jgi:hypothetical protein
MKRGRLGIVVVMILSLLTAAFLRSEATDWQTRESGRGDAGPGGLSNLSSFALALVLGGLRGPLVMFLWSTSETQKNDRDLADFDTKVEWIRLLQPEFDTVHLFQIWNKAYNISVLMASPADKYVVVMQALDYAHSVLLDKPGDINILAAIANVYSNKLGAHIAHPEEHFYNRQLREESMTDAARKFAYPEDKNYVRLWNGTLSLDDHNNILPELLAPTRSTPAGESGQWNDGAPLQYLAKFQPFPLGISPSALAYNYAKAAQVAQSAEGQRPQQLSPMVIDSRPGVELEGWSLEEVTLAREAESRAFGIEVPDSPTAENAARCWAIPPAARPADANQLETAIEEYGRAVTVAQEAAAEFRRHLADPAFAIRLTLYRSHFDDLNITSEMSRADGDYLQIRNASGAQAARLRAATVAEYQRSVLLNERMVLQYYMEDSIIAAVLGPHTSNETIRGLTDDQVLQAFARAMPLADQVRFSAFSDDRDGYVESIERAGTRLKLLQGGS